MTVFGTLPRHRFRIEITYGFVGTLEIGMNGLTSVGIVRLDTNELIDFRHSTRSNQASGITDIRIKEVVT
jgi:hypothetical protein